MPIGKMVKKYDLEYVVGEFYACIFDFEVIYISNSIKNIALYTWQKPVISIEKRIEDSMLLFRLMEK